MKKSQILVSLIMALLTIFGSVGTVAAEETPVAVTGTIQSIKLDTDTETNLTTVIVKLLDSSNKAKSYRISLESAITLMLVSLDPVTNNPVVDMTKIGQEISIDLSLILEDDVVVTEGDHPVASLLAGYFKVEYETIMGYHTSGFGFGTIAQSLWMASKLGDLTLAGQILDAKKTGDFSAFLLPDETAPANWGQFRKAVLGRGKANAGMIISGKAETPEDDVITDEDQITDDTTIQNAGNSDHDQGNRVKPENDNKPDKAKGPKNKKP